MSEFDDDSQRTPVDCPHRRHASGQTAVCGLVESYIADSMGMNSVEECTVSEEMCRACCRSFPPTPAHPNPVVASALLAAMSRVINPLPSADPRRQRLESLRRFGLEYIPTESDLQQYEHVARLERPSGSRDAQPICIPRPRRRSGPIVRSWAVGITSAPRREPTLDRTRDSLAQAGWTEPHLFLDGPVSRDHDRCFASVTHRDPAVGAWPNYFLSLAELLMRNPQAEAYLLLQDDVCVYPHSSVRPYLEQMLWPGASGGLVSLYCPKSYTSAKDGWTTHPGQWLWGALAFIFSRNAARKFLSSQMVLQHRWQPGSEGLAHIDRLIGQWAFRERIPIWYPTPSIVQHIGRTSAIWKGAQFSGERMASRFLGDADDVR